jgi:hypothetical protein
VAGGPRMTGIELCTSSELAERGKAVLFDVLLWN